MILQHSDDSYNEEECSEIFKKLIHPSSCCDYPQREIPDSVQEQCKHFCMDVKDHEARGCCLINCNYHKTGVFVNGKFNAKSLMQLYENYLNEHGGGKYDSWAEIIEQSVNACRNLGSILFSSRGISSSFKSFKSCFNFYLYSEKFR